MRFRCYPDGEQKRKLRQAGEFFVIAKATSEFPRAGKRILHRLSYALFYRIWDIIAEIPTGRIIGMCVTQFLALFLALLLQHLMLLPVLA